MHQFSDAEEDNSPLVINNNDDISKLFGEMTFNNNGRKLVNDQNTYDTDYSDDSSDDETLFDNGCYSRKGANEIKAQIQSTTPNQQNKNVKISDYQPSENVIKKFLDKVNTDPYEGPVLTHEASNKLMESYKKADAMRFRNKDKCDRATAEQVMDPRTRMILFKLLNRGMIGQIDGCISTGKEANVYHSTSTDSEKHYAIKVFKTSILVFKDRDRYVTGEFRFRHGYCRHNPRKMVRLWAEKEMRNLARMYAAGLPVPQPILLRSHVLMMSFIGKDGWPAPKLKDARLTTSKACQLYRDCLIIMWKLYNICKLVHADLSEFNLLYNDGEIVMIDVSQAVEHEHPYALEFLRKDCTNITEFFRHHDVGTLTIKCLFDFLTDPTITLDNMETCLDRLQVNMVNSDPLTNEEMVEQEVFKNAYIPKNLNEVVDFERDISLVKSGQTSEDLIYQKIVGLKDDLSGPQNTPAILEDDDSDDTNSSTSEKESIDSDEKSKFSNSARPKNEDAESKRLRKKQVKDEKADKRKVKLKKHLKKRKEKTTQCRKK
ncbi:serine/threonine-protein kinase RIO1 [Metopolophium dirhodum]|uniref:serine/threonine-protein kinase RIO1 n=1 Tax=Metopolophium dirhodum TaxID=44670 RepID=UPI0029902EF4|nr:serine/threonine-protein kinase RIO1 [Metopolophium dirhodum]XP_060864182.1 serine/threonine-protein kinase RIO1 [Metopolophium dirhodum]